MNWIFIGLLLGSTVTSQHDTREACEGRAVVLKEKGVTGKCVEMRFSLGITQTWSGSNELRVCTMDRCN